LDDEQRLLVIISNNLLNHHDEELLQVLKVHNKVIGWTLADIPEISPVRCVHKILLEDESNQLTSHK